MHAVAVELGKNLHSKCTQPHMCHINSKRVSTQIGMLDHMRMHARCSYRARQNLAFRIGAARARTSNCSNDHGFLCSAVTRATSLFGPHRVTLSQQLQASFLQRRCLPSACSLRASQKFRSSRSRAHTALTTMASAPNKVLAHQISDWYPSIDRLVPLEYREAQCTAQAQQPRHILLSNHDVYPCVLR